MNIDNIDTWTPDVVFTVWFYAIDDTSHIKEPLGIIVFKEWTNRVVAYHGAMYKKHRGEKTPIYVKEALDIVREQLGCVFVTTVPATNRLSCKLNEKLGMKLKTVIPDGYREKEGFSDLLLYSEN